ncbi:MAG: DNA-directed RNA polymerase subunit beta, partial [Halanaerobacter sp.]
MVNPSHSITRQRRSFGKVEPGMDVPYLLKTQKKSYEWFLEEAILNLFAEISPITDFSENLVLEFIDYSLDEPKYDRVESKNRDVSYEAALNAKVRLINQDTGEIKEQDVFMTNFPLMTDKGTFIINGAERVVVNQLIRSSGT